MQQVKYPDLNIPSQETLSQQLFENNNQNVKFIPVVTPTNNQIPQQPQLPQLPQIQQLDQNLGTPYQQYSNYQVTQQESPASNFIKDQDFQKQKKLLLKILGIFILWTILSFLIYIFFCFTLFRVQKIEMVYFFFLFISVISIPILVKVGLGQNYRNNQFSIFILIGLIVSYTIFYLGILGVIMHDIHDYWASLAIFIIFSIIIGINFISNFIMLIYLFLEDKHIRIIYVYVIHIIVILLFCLLLKEFSYVLILAIPYPFCVLNVFRQIQKGRFNLQDDQVFTASIVASYGTLICCYD